MLRVAFSIRPLYFRGGNPANGKTSGPSQFAENTNMHQVLDVVSHRHPELLWHAADRFDRRPESVAQKDMVFEDKAEDMQLFLKHKADPIQARTPEGEPLLSWAIRNQHPILFNLLLGHFKNEPRKLKELVNQVDTEGHSALHWGADIGDVQIVQTLLNAGADPDLANDLEERPLHFATSDSQQDKYEVVGSFIHAKAELAAQASDLQTPLHRSAMYGLIKSAKALIDALMPHPELLDLPDEFSKTPKQYAEEAGHWEIANYFPPLKPPAYEANAESSQAMQTSPSL